MKMMKFSFILVLLLFVVGFLGCTATSSGVKQPSDAASSAVKENVADNSASQYDINMSECEKVSDLAYKSDCISKVGAAFKNCDNLAVSEKTICYQVRAKNEEDVSLCDKARDSTWKGSETVVYSCYLDVAQVKEDVAICQQLNIIEQNGSYKDNHYTNLCYSVLAKILKQKEICENMIVANEDDQNSKDYCIRAAS